MAVTQLLARISPDRLRQCSREVHELDRLVKLDLSPPESYIDLSWSPSCLIGGFNRAGEDDIAQWIERLCGDGAAPVNIHFPEGSVTDPVYSSITYSEPSLVAEAFKALKALHRHQVELMLSHAADIGCKQGIDSIFEARRFNRAMFDQLVEFTGAAAASHQTVVAWWD